MNSTAFQGAESARDTNLYVVPRSIPTGGASLAMTFCFWTTRSVFDAKQIRNASDKGAKQWSPRPQIDFLNMPEVSRGVDSFDDAKDVTDALATMTVSIRERYLNVYGVLKRNTDCPTLSTPLPVRVL